VKVGINARILNTETLRGWSRYTHNLLKMFAKKNVDVILFSDNPINKKFVPEEYQNKIIIKKGINYLHWEQVVLPRMAKEFKVDILHCPTNYGLPFWGKFKKVLTLHDAIEKSFYDQDKNSLDKLQWNHLKIRGLHYLSQIAADAVITVSEFARKDIMTSYSLSENKIKTIYEAADEAFQASSVLPFLEFSKRSGISKEQYYLYVGGLEKRKNIELLIRLAEELRNTSVHFLIAGGERSEVEKYRSMVSDKNLSNIIFIGYIEESLLPSLYGYSKCFIYPSFAEGFGLQVVEALQMRRPVLCSNNSSLTEVLGSEIYGFNPVELDEAKTLILKMETDDFYKQALSFVDKRRDFFNWEKTAEETLKVYTSVL
jgi:glycosyltransferase involved in cell wall biosynthesis